MHKEFIPVLFAREENPRRMRCRSRKDDVHHMYRLTATSSCDNAAIIPTAQTVTNQSVGSSENVKHTRPGADPLANRSALAGVRNVVRHCA